MYVVFDNTSMVSCYSAHRELTCGDPRAAQRRCRHAMLVPRAHCPAQWAWPAKGYQTQLMPLLAPEAQAWQAPSALGRSEVEELPPLQHLCPWWVPGFCFASWS